MIEPKPATKPCPTCQGGGVLPLGGNEYTTRFPCPNCEDGRVPVTDGELEAQGQLRMI